MLARCNVQSKFRSASSRSGFAPAGRAELERSAPSQVPPTDRACGSGRGARVEALPWPADSRPKDRQHCSRHKAASSRFQTYAAERRAHTHTCSTPHMLSYSDHRSHAFVHQLIDVVMPTAFRAFSPQKQRRSRRLDPVAAPLYGASSRFCRADHCELTCAPP
eukprot:SAG31_NODE_1514_length_8042_cov_6.955936_9_plen_163_part_00